MRWAGRWNSAFTLQGACPSPIAPLLRYDACMTITIPGGLLIAIDGIDGAGKTTLADRLRQRIEAAGASVLQSKEPTAGQWGRKLRESAAAGRLSPAEELEYLLLDRRQHVADLVMPALEQGSVVILDRYFPSTIAYQGAAGLPVEDLLVANEFAPAPDLLLLLDVDPEVGLARIRSRGDKPNHFETAENLAACREIFLSLDLPNMHVVDASEDADSVLEQAHARALLAITAKLRQSHGPVETVELIQRFLAGAL